jgi:hypothetical protein
MVLAYNYFAFCQLIFYGLPTLRLGKSWRATVDESKANSPNFFLIQNNPTQNSKLC